MMTGSEIVGLAGWAGFAWGLILIPYTPRLGLGLSLVSAVAIFFTRPTGGR
jgi:hypothetical protein